jgi:UDP-N-acetylmuramoylalanine--D-glutamate ligase
MGSKFDEFKSFINGKSTAVVGIGVSNIPLIRSLVGFGAKVSAFDKKNGQELGEIGEEFKALGVKLVLGENYLEELTGFQVVFKTPSMRIDHTALLKCKDEGTYITSEMEEFVKYCPGKIFGITGSDGKTTTTTMIYNILKESGYKTWVGGNIGTPLFSNLEQMTENDKIVLELSSFQLMTMKQPIEAALITNITPNHLDIHKDMEEYKEAKENIYKYQTKGSLLVLNKDNEITDAMDKNTKSLVRKFSVKEKIAEGSYFENNNLYVYGKKVCEKKEVKLKGMHNIENLLAAFSMTYDDASIEAMRKVAINFRGVEHRSEFVAEIDGVEYYNDSIASSPTRTIAGLKAFEKEVILIAGGYDKKIPFEALSEDGYPYIKKLILLGATKEKIREVFEKESKNQGKKIDTYVVENLDEAVRKAQEVSEYGDIITLSPACASFDQFVNFEVRGQKYKEIVNNMIKKIESNNF